MISNINLNECTERYYFCAHNEAIKAINKIKKKQKQVCLSEMYCHPINLTYHQ